VHARDQFEQHLRSICAARGEPDCDSVSRASALFKSKCAAVHAQLNVSKCQISLPRCTAMVLRLHFRARCYGEHRSFSAYPS
jgi:hypothetical protein